MKFDSFAVMSPQTSAPTDYFGHPRAQLSANFRNASASGRQAGDLCVQVALLSQIGRTLGGGLVRRPRVGDLAGHLLQVRAHRMKPVVLCQPRI